MEVEKGPQGTLFGRNATGGVVQVFTRNPSRTGTADVNVGYGNFDTTYANGYLSGPLTGTLSGDLAAYTYNQGDGWGTNVFSGHDVYKNWNNGGRVKLLWQPTEKTSALLTYDIDVTRTDVGISSPVQAAGTLAVAGGPPPKATTTWTRKTRAPSPSSRE